MKKILLGLAAVALTGALAKDTITISTGGLSGTYYPMGNDIASIFDNTRDDIEKTCQYDLEIINQEGHGSVANVQGVANKKFNAGIVQIDVLKYLNRQKPGKYSDKKMKIITGLHKESIHVLIPKGYQPKSDKGGLWGSFMSKFTGSKPIKLDLQALKGQVIEASGGSVVSAKALSLFFDLNAQVVDRKGNWTGKNPVVIVAGQPNKSVQDLLDTGKWILASVDSKVLQRSAPFYLDDELVYNVNGVLVNTPSVAVQAVLIGKQYRSKKKNEKMMKLASCLTDEEILGEFADREDTVSNWNSVYDLAEKDIDIDWDMFPLMDDYGKGE